MNVKESKRNQSYLPTILIAKLHSCPTLLKMCKSIQPSANKVVRNTCRYIYINLTSYSAWNVSPASSLLIPNFSFNLPVV